MVRFVIGSRRNAKRYLEKRSLARPRILEKAINDIKAQNTQSRPVSSYRALIEMLHSCNQTAGCNV